MTCAQDLDVFSTHCIAGAAERLQAVSGQMCIYLICFHTWREDLVSYVDKTIITFPILWLLNISITYP